ncbi:hypothetical protein N7468_010580 [Penicillium chermesinum]|uniref:Sodium/calcium exchanger membrane region domain-containing protein n=1 Tax=Penicillium chermesinum TaxID=63820 RepID=A0A9W9N7Z1_9EURO|nr:uncharacterized protein N7468_010580 [Penicillium chermesinum]KAJ5214901.1 hypothetical protein N7468_010580 [Penicillium chermesinum]
MIPDIYRRQARNLAWYDEEGEVTHNPFKKFKRRPQRRQSIQLEESQPGATRGLDAEDIAAAEAATRAYDAAHPNPINSYAREGQSEPRRRKLFGLGKKTEPEDEEEEKFGETKQRFTLASQLRATVFNSWINVLILAAPAGIALYAVGANSVAIFVVNFIAIIPLAAMLSYATEEIALRTGETIGGLLNASFGNAVELIVSIIALVQDEVLIVQTSLIGSMLSNLLLVMGMCFFCGGINRMEQHFNVTVAQTAASLLALAVASLIIPTAFHNWSDAKPADLISNTAQLSRGTSVLLLIVYGAYLFFQLKSHTEMYNRPSPKVEKRRQHIGEGDASRGLASIGKMTAGALGAQSDQVQMQDPDDEPEQPQLSVLSAILTLVISTALVGVCAEFMVDAIDDVTASGAIGKTFDKMDLAIGVAVGSSMQIALLVLPLVVVIGWCMGKDDMTLNFDGFQVILLFVAVLLVNYLIGDGKSHWLEGVLLMTMYLIIAVAAWFF